MSTNPRPDQPENGESAEGDNSPKPLARLNSIAPYQQGQSKIEGQTSVIKLSSNEGCFGPSPAAVDAYRATANELHRYPDGRQTALRNAVAKVYGLDADRIVCGNGSEELIGLLMRCFVDEGDELLLSENHFVMCSIYGKAQGARIVLAPESQFTTDIDALISRITPRTRMLAVANPNNPTGTYNSASDIDRLIAAVPSDVVILLDGAYAEYVVEKDYEAGARWVDAHENVVMTRTFSKMYGLAGLRIGWAYGSSAIIEVMNRLRTPFNTNISALAAAEAAVQDFAHVERVIEHNNRWQQRFQEELGAVGIHVVPSVTNFYLMHFEDIDGKSADGAGTWLKANGIIPRPASDDRCLRLTVGNDEENEAVISTLKSYVAD